MYLLEAAKACGRKGSRGWMRKTEGGQKKQNMGRAAATRFQELYEVFLLSRHLILAQDHFLAHGSIINAETMDMCLTRRWLFISGPFVEEEAEHEKRYQDK